MASLLHQTPPLNSRWWWLSNAEQRPGLNETVFLLIVKFPPVNSEKRYFNIIHLLYQKETLCILWCSGSFLAKKDLGDRFFLLFWVWVLFFTLSNDSTQLAYKDIGQCLHITSEIQKRVNCPSPAVGCANYLPNSLHSWMTPRNFADILQIVFAQQPFKHK